jgi:N-acetylglucosamine-6-phosphate deacetylase
MKKTIKSNRIYTQEGLISGTIIIDGTRIEGITDSSTEQIDYGNHRIIPGIIDVHNHGIAGISISNKAEELKKYTKALTKVGVTGVLPTIAHHMKPVQITQDISSAKRHGARLLGIHSEGPYLNPKQYGAGIRADGSTLEIPKPTVKAIENLYEQSGRYLKYITIAPEIVNDKAVFDFLKSKNIVIAAGHTEMSYTRFQEAVKDGVTVTTHTGNAMRGINHREVGTLGAALLCDKVFCELIADFIHICPEMIKIMFKVKNPDLFVLVSDSIPLAGMPPGVYDMLGCKLTLTDDGRVLTEAGRLAGSSKHVLSGIENLVEKMGIPMETTLKMTGTNPAKLLGIDDKKGSIAIGKDADLVVIDDAYNVIATYVEGELIQQL